MVFEVHDFINYVPPPQPPEDCESCPEDLKDEILEWKERMKYIHDDIDWLLRLPREQFWQQIINDRTFSQSYDSFWQFCPRPHDLHMLPNQCIPIHNQMKKLMLLLFLRICDDTEMDGIADSSHASVIYDNFLIDVPKIIDICSIYSSAPVVTRNLISKALSRIFQKQEGYWGDLDIAIDTIFKTFDNVLEKFALLEDDDGVAPKQLSSKESMQFSNEELSDALVYLYDTFNSLVSLLRFCGFTSNAFLAQGALQRTAMMVDKYLPQLKDCFQMGLLDSQRKCFSRTKNLCLHFCDLLLKECFFQGPSTALNEKSKCHEYLNVIDTLLPETRFIIKYEKRYNLISKLNNIDENLQSEFEEAIQYIQQVLYSLLPNAVATKSSDGLEQAGATAGMTDDAVDSIILQVKAMLPDENDAFLRACVVHFNGDAEKVVNHLLENNIPPFLQEIRESRKTLEKRLDPFETELERRTPANQLPGRYYLKSEVTSKDIQDEIFHSEKALGQFSSVATDHDYTTLMRFDEYDDEYDDTYDSHNVGAMDADSGDELKDLVSRRSLVKPRVLQALEKNGSDKDDDDNDEQEGNSNSEEKKSQVGKGGKKQTVQQYNSGPAHRHGPDHKRGDRKERFNRERQDNATRAHGDRNSGNTRGRGETRSSQSRGRGGHAGKRYNQKSARGMAGF